MDGDQGQPLKKKMIRRTTTCETITSNLLQPNEGLPEINEKAEEEGISERDMNDRERESELRGIFESIAHKTDDGSSKESDNLERGENNKDLERVDLHQEEIKSD